MKTKRKQELKDAVLSHIAKTIRGELHDWGNLKEWLSVDLENEDEEDIVEDMFNLEIKRLCRRIG